MNESPKLGSAWGVVGDTSTWMQIRETSDGRVVGRMFNGGEKHISSNFPPSGYVRIDKPSILRTDTEGRDVTNLPGMWSEDDTITDLSQPFTVEWLCEIGGVRTSCDVAFRNEHDDCLACLLLSFGHKWFFNSRGVSTPITTRGDVLKWLDVLGVPATTKGSP